MKLSFNNSAITGEISLHNTISTAIDFNYENSSYHLSCSNITFLLSEI